MHTTSSLLLLLVIVVVLVASLSFLVVLMVVWRVAQILQTGAMVECLGMVDESGKPEMRALDVDVDVDVDVLRGGVTLLWLDDVL